MKEFKIIVDSTFDLSKELIDLIDPAIVPLNVTIGEETFLDYVEFSADDLYKKMAETGIIPKTGAASPGTFAKIYEQVKNEGYKDAVVISISESFSASIKSAVLAQDLVEGINIHIVDSSSFSSGSGLLALRAHDLREEGKSAVEVAAYLNEIAPRVRAQFIVDNLKMLHAGGRVTGMKYVFGQMLRAHPFLQINDRKLEIVATPKGKSVRALDVMIDVFLKENAEGIESPRVLITHSHGGDRVDYIKERLLGVVDEKNIYVTPAGSVISSHCGEGTIGILYIRK